MISIIHKKIIKISIPSLWICDGDAQIMEQVEALRREVVELHQDQTMNWAKTDQLFQRSRAIDNQIYYQLRSLSYSTKREMMAKFAVKLKSILERRDMDELVALLCADVALYFDAMDCARFFPYDEELVNQFKSIACSSAFESKLIELSSCPLFGRKHLLSIFKFIVFATGAEKTINPLSLKAVEALSRKDDEAFQARHTEAQKMLLASPVVPCDISLRSNLKPALNKYIPRFSVITPRRVAQNYCLD